MKLNIRNTIIFLVFGIYPIIPQYFGIMGISAFKLMCLGIVLFACVALGISKSVAYFMQEYPDCFWNLANYYVYKRNTF